jgi:hypothetical protein
MGLATGAVRSDGPDGDRVIREVGGFRASCGLVFGWV